MKNNIVKTDEVQFEEDTKYLTFYFDRLVDTYLGIRSRIMIDREKTPYDLNSISLSLSLCINSLLEPIVYKDKNVTICKHCKKLYIKGFPCYELYKNNGIITDCVKEDNVLNDDYSFGDYLEFKDEDDE
jgi:hypothetical protein